MTTVANRAASLLIVSLLGPTAIAVPGARAQTPTSTVELADVRMRDASVLDRKSVV